MDLVGWKFAIEEKKRKPFNQVAEVLGAMVDLSESCKGRIVLSNKPARIDEIEETVRSMASTGQCTAHEAQQLRGRLVFAEGQLFNRVSKTMAPLLHQRANSGGGLKNFTTEMEAELRWLVDNLRRARPRTVEALDTRPAIKVLTDASWELASEKAGLGGVLLDESGRPSAYFSAWVPKRIWKMLGRGSAHIITPFRALGGVRASCAV